MAWLHLRQALILIALAVLYSSQASALRLPSLKSKPATTAPSPAQPVPTSGTFPLTNVRDLGVATTVNVAGQPLNLVLDTGSADLWVNPKDLKSKALKATSDTKTTATVAYNDLTFVSGNVVTASTDIGGLKADSQALISMSTKPDSVLPFTNGLLGLGPNGNSVITEKLGRTGMNGKTFLSNFFSQSKSKDKFMSFFITRPPKGANAKAIPGGSFTINEVLPQFQAIRNQPKLPVSRSKKQWEVELRSVTINGKTYPLKTSRFSSFATLDTGDTFGSAPGPLVDLMYKSIPGATLDKRLGQRYHFPCDVMVNVTLNFGNGVSVPMHPIEMSAMTALSSPNCVGTFTDSKSDDWVLGNSFFRNVYSLHDFGSFEEGSTEEPFVQLLPLTDMNKAQSEFKQMAEDRAKQYKKEFKP